MIRIKSQLREILNNQGFQRYSINTAWVMGEKISRMFIGIFVISWIARYLGPQQFGLLNYAQSFVFLFTAISTLGLDSIVVRELVKKEDNRNKLLGSAFFLKLIGALILLPIIVIIVQFTSNDNYTNLLIFIIAFATIFQSFNVIDFYFQSKVISKYTAIANSVTFGISSLIKILLIIINAPLVAFALMSIFDIGILATGLLLFYLSHVKKHDLQPDKRSFFGWEFDKKTAYFLLKSSWPLILSTIVITIYMRIDQVMIKEILDFQSVGQYAAATRLSEAWYFIPVAIVNSLFPAIVNAKKVSSELYIKRLQSLYTLLVWLAIAVSILISFFGDSIVMILYGNDFSQAASVLIIHIWTGIFVFLGIAFSSYLIAENWAKKAFYRTLLGAIINIILNIILIPNYGLIGAAIATLIGQLVANVIYDIFDKSLWPQLGLKLKAFFPIYILRS